MNDAVRVVATNAVSVPLDSVVFLLIAFGSLEFIEGQIVVKYAATVVVGIPLVLSLRRFVSGGLEPVTRPGRRFAFSAKRPFPTS